MPPPEYRGRRRVDNAAFRAPEGRTGRYAYHEEVEEQRAMGVGSAALDVGAKRDRMKAPVVGECAVSAEHTELARSHPSDLQACFQAAELERPQPPR